MFMEMTLNKRKYAYLNYARITHAFSKLEYGKETDEDKEIIKLYSSIINSGMPLPSGRWGTSLAVALENHYFISAWYLLLNKEKLNISIDSVSSELGGADRFDLEKEFELALTYFDMETLEDSVYFSMTQLKKDPKVMKTYLENTKSSIENIKKYIKTEKIKKMSKK